MRARAIKNQGMNWISQHRRLAIYLRDNLSCVYCGKGIEDGIKLTLDHLKAYNKGGMNESENLITSCLVCNVKKSDKTLHSFVPLDVYRRIRRQVKRKLNIEYAKHLIRQRGSCKKVLTISKRK
jgi:5-methylcytosine-specific restriction endonuclease McrA